MSYPYNRLLTPPFPQVEVTIYQTGTKRAINPLSAEVDTGADITLVPSDYLKTIQADEIYQSRLRSQWGEHRKVSIYSVDLEIAGELLADIEVAADQLSTSVLLGRNATNKLILLLDGPRELTDILTRRPRRLPIAKKT